MSEADGALLSRCAIQLLRAFPANAGTSAQLSAALAVQLERILSIPVHVVAGTLAVEKEPVFGDRLPFDGPAIFSTAEPDWSGHVWLMVGAHVVDISLFRIAYSRFGPPRLARHVDLVFGPGKGLYVDVWQQCRRRGLSYEPQYILTEVEVTRLMGGAYALIEQARSERSAGNPSPA